MADAGRSDPFGDVISLVAGPVAAAIRSFDQLRRGSEELMKGLENFNRTMENLNETAARINGLLNEFEAPVRAMIPQLTRTVKLADDFSARLSGPLDQVIPGLNRLADVLNAPVLAGLPRDLGQFVDAINDVTRRMSPLAQLADQAGGLFGLRIPGLSPPRPAAAPPPATVAPAVTPDPAAAAKKTAATRRAPTKRAPAGKSTAKRSTTKRSQAKKSPARKKKAAAKRS